MVARKKTGKRERERKQEEKQEEREEEQREREEKEREREFLCGICRIQTSCATRSGLSQTGSGWCMTFVRYDVNVCCCPVKPAHGSHPTWERSRTKILKLLPLHTRWRPRPRPSPTTLIVLYSFKSASASACTKH